MMYYTRYVVFVFVYFAKGELTHIPNQISVSPSLTFSIQQQAVKEQQTSIDLEVTDSTFNT